MNQRSETYNGNQNLRKAGVSSGYTQDQINEIKKCRDDPEYFSQNYIKITHVDDGLIAIDLYDYQREIIQKIHKNRRVAVCTSRQAGKTTTAVCVILHYVLFNKFKTVALLANKGDAAREILERIQLAYENLPTWLQQGVSEWNKGSVSFENGCKIIAAATSSSAIRGKSVSLLYIDETAFVENWDQFYASVYPTISSGKKTKILFTSTPNGLNHFYKTCTGAREGRNGFQYVEVTWDKVPGRDKAWKQDTLASMDFDEEKFAQEFECEFLGSSGTLIAGWKLKELVHIEPFRKHKGLSAYKAPLDDHKYMMTVDVSRGKGLDYSAVQVIDVTKMPYEQVAVYRSNMVTPTDFASTVDKISRAYNNAQVLVEVNDIGGQVADVLWMDYANESLIHTESAGRLGKRVTFRSGSSVDRGIRTTKTVKNVGCSILKLIVEQNQLIINDFETIRELSTFSLKNSSYEAEPGCHDDLVMCLVLFGWLSGQQYFTDFTSINTLDVARDRTEEEIMNELIPFGIVVDGVEPISDEPAFVEADGTVWRSVDSHGHVSY